jgi:hypothetical protein
MSRCPTFIFQLSIISKWLAKHISTKVSFKITINKRHVYIDIGLPWVWNQCFYLGIWNYDRTKFFLSFQLDTRLNSQNTNETAFINIFLHINCIWLLVIPISLIEVSNQRKWNFLLYFIFLKNYWPLSTWNSLVHSSWGEMERCEKRAFQVLKMRKEKISWNLKPSA